MIRSTRLFAFGSVLALALTAGCNNSLDHDSAVKVTQSALSGTIAADVHVMTGNLPSGDIDVTLTNPSGSGTAHVTGTVTKTADHVNTTLDITFSHWNDPKNQVTLDGALHETGTLAAPLPLSGSVHLSGALSVTGSVTAAADFDLTGSYSPNGLTVAGHVGGESIDVSISL